MAGLMAEFKGTVRKGSEEKKALSPSGCCFKIMTMSGGMGKEFRNVETITKISTVIAACRCFSVRSSLLLLVTSVRFVERKLRIATIPHTTDEDMIRDTLTNRM
jgi:hypothetical protein